MLTGYQRRTYPIMSESDDVFVGGNAIPLQRLAAPFSLSWCIDRRLLAAGSNHVVGSYRRWRRYRVGLPPGLAGRRHPAPLLHWIYYVYRAIVYGMPVRDIEYIQINITRRDGLIQKILYEVQYSFCL